MKTLPKFLIALSMAFAGISSASAQSDFGPGSIAWEFQMQQQINALNAQTAAMQQQVLRYYQQQAAAASLWMQTTPFQPMPGVVTYDGVYLSPDTVNDYHKEQVKCEHCDGGYNYSTVYMGGGETRQIKSRCSWCYGNGYVTKTVRND